MQIVIGVVHVVCLTEYNGCDLKHGSFYATPRSTGLILHFPFRPKNRR
jgi:hypothetical protein